MRLETWLKDNELSTAEFAERIGVTRTAVDRYCSGHRRPKWEVLKKITKATQGDVKPEDFFESECLVA